jgi:hypothetical protein
VENSPSGGGVFCFIELGKRAKGNMKKKFLNVIGVLLVLVARGVLVLASLVP